MKDTNAEKTKNLELEKEFIVLRGLIQEQNKPQTGHEVLIMKSQYENERGLRMSAETDVGRLRQQLADTVAGGHRDTSNLKKALSDLHALNQHNLQTIYEKGDQNLANME